MSNPANNSGSSSSAPNPAAASKTVGASPELPNAQPAGQAKTPPEPVRTLKLKVEGKELELPESEVIALAQQGKSAAQRFQEAARLRKETEAVVNFIKSNPKEAMKHLGIDPRKFSEEVLMEAIQLEAMTPEQKRLHEAETKLKQIEAEKKRQAEAARQKEIADLTERHRQNYEKMFIDALSAEALPKTAYTVKRMAELTIVAQKKGINVDSRQIAKLVREDYQNEIKALYQNSDPETLRQLLGEDALKKLRQDEISKLKSQPQKFTQSNPSRKAQSEARKTLKKDTWAEFKKKNRSFI